MKELILEEIIFSNILLEIKNDEKWLGSKFENIKVISNTKVGDVGELFIKNLCDHESISCVFNLDENGEKLRTGPWDIKIENLCVEVKTATEDINGSFQFNGIRPYRNYDCVLCLGISPNKLYFNIWSKDDVVKEKAGHLVPMDKNNTMIYKLTKKPNCLLEITKFKSKITDFISRY